MVSPNVDKLLQAVASLSEAEREEFRRLLGGRFGGAAGQSGEEQLRRQLIADGLLSETPAPQKDRDRYRRWQPVPIQGKPLSETIVEERR